MEAARSAGATDLVRLAELSRQAASELSGHRGGAILLEREALAEPVEEAIVEALADPSRSLWAGTLAGQVVGYGLGRREILADGTAHGRVEALYVEPAGRGVGVGEAIMGAMTAWFREGGCRGIDALALPGQRAAKSFLEAAGYKARLIVMYRSLPA